MFKDQTLAQVGQIVGPAEVTEPRRVVSLARPRLGNIYPCFNNVKTHCL